METESSVILLSKLVQNFFKGNLNFWLLPDDVQNMSLDLQQDFLDATLNTDLLKKYPIRGKYVSLFLKKIINFLEPIQEVHDDIYAQLCSAMNETDTDGFSYRHYVIGDDINNIVTIKESRNMVFNGTTGLKTWEAALILSDWALCNHSIFLNKNVLELGSGVGFTGITIGKLCDIKSLILTDYHNEVLDKISNNIQINFPDFIQEKTSDITLFKDNNKSLGVMMLDWNAIEDLSESIIPDIVIGADIVYDPSILLPLCKVIQTLCSRNKCLEVYIASVVRNEETFNSFLETLVDMKLDFEKIELPKSVFIEWDESIQKCMLKIKPKLYYSCSYYLNSQHFIGCRKNSTRNFVEVHACFISCYTSYKLLNFDKLKKCWLKPDIV